METLPEIYPLTSLQIGDIQSHKSQVFLYFATSTRRLLILVDNRPWSLIKHSRSTQLWQMMVTKYRVSPFINTRAVAHSSTHGRRCCLGPNHEKKRFTRLLSIVKLKLYKKSLFSIKICKALSGLIVFDLSWKDVDGIKYMNELQTDTSLAMEVHSMRKWEFDGIDHAMSCISLWFPGNGSEMESLLQNLRKLSDLNVHHWMSLVSSKHILFRNTSLLETCARKDLFDDAEESLCETDADCSTNQPFAGENILEKAIWNGDEKLGSEYVGAEEIPKPVEYGDNLLLLKFSDNILPFKLRQVLMSDPRLLRLLESGLPMWVIFFQSYPLFCHLYRPWIRHLTHALYVLISLSTFLIAFNDLYKKVPILRAGIVMVCGPVFDWIEKWDMGYRIKYLGTMLFLQNIEKAIECFVAFVRAVKPLVAVITKPFKWPLMQFFEFFSPLFHVFAETGELIISTMWLGIDYLHDILLDLINFFLHPFELVYSCLLDIASSVYLVISSIWESFYALLRPMITVGIYFYSMIKSFFSLVKNAWNFISGAFSFMNLFHTYEMPTWGDLWSDISKQAFLAVQSIINGLSAFFIICNAYCLRIYDYVCTLLDGLGQSQLLGHD